MTLVTIYLTNSSSQKNYGNCPKEFSSGLTQKQFWIVGTVLKLAALKLGNSPVAEHFVDGVVQKQVTSLELSQPTRKPILKFSLVYAVVWITSCGFGQVTGSR